jgi:5-(carboxyamino)imidazole ribonucleotide synthase
MPRHDTPADPSAPSLVAVLGGGQLGRMLGLAAIPLGIRCRFLDPSPDATAAAVGELVVGELDDPGAIERTAQGANVVTYEWEGVPAPAARAAMQTHAVRPDPRALEVAQDRLTEKQTLERLGIGVAPFAPIDGPDDVASAVTTLGVPLLFKTRRGGYDGKGQQLVHDAAGAQHAWDALGGVQLIAEGVVDFDRELSVLAARAPDGTVACYPLVQNEHSGGILRTSRAPAPALSPALQAAGEQIAQALLEDLDYVGLLAIELFERRGELLANEIAPRVHNSGHWTIEGAATSQFEQHLRAVLGLPLGSTQTRGHSGMVNCIGSLPDAAAVLSVPGAHLHAYGKAPRPGRKVGHVTVVADDAAARDERLAQVRALQRDDG